MRSLLCALAALAPRAADARKAPKKFASARELALGAPAVKARGDNLYCVSSRVVSDGFKSAVREPDCLGFDSRRSTHRSSPRRSRESRCSSRRSRSTWLSAAAAARAPPRTTTSTRPAGPSRASSSARTRRRPRPRRWTRRITKRKFRYRCAHYWDYMSGIQKQTLCLQVVLKFLNCEVLESGSRLMLLLGIPLFLPLGSQWKRTKAR